MKYWDTSALVPLLVDEARSDDMERLRGRDPRIITWGWTRVEIAAALARRSRDGGLSGTRRREALDRFAVLADSWNEVSDLIAVRTRAFALVGRHPLRAADAAHLGAALWVAGDDPSSLEFVCIDGRLADAAEREGLRVLG